MNASCFARSSSREMALGLRCSMPRRCNSAIRPDRLSYSMANSRSIQTPTSRVVRGNVSPIQSVSLSCCSAVNRQLPPSWPKLARPSMPSSCQTLDAVFLIVLVPGPDSVIVDEQNPTDGLAVHAAIQQQQRIRPARQTMRHRPITGEVDQVMTRFGVEEAGTDHARTGIANGLIRKGVFRVSEESGYSVVKFTENTITVILRPFFFETRPFP